MQFLRECETQIDKYVCTYVYGQGKNESTFIECM